MKTFLAILLIVFLIIGLAIMWAKGIEGEEWDDNVPFP